MWNGRQYHGQLNGRRVDGYFYRGPSLDIYIESSINTRMSFTLQRPISEDISQTAGVRVHITHDSPLAHHIIFADDEHWARGLLDNSAARELILRLTSAQTGSEYRNLFLKPEAIQLQINHINWKDNSVHKLQSTVDDLISLSGIAESQTAPMFMSSAGYFERKTRLDRTSLSQPIFWVTCGVIAFLLISLLIIILFLINLLPKV